MEPHERGWRGRPSTCCTPSSAISSVAWPGRRGRSRHRSARRRSRLDTTAVVVGPRGKGAALGVVGLEDLQSAGAYASDLDVDVVDDRRPERLLERHCPRASPPRSGRPHRGPLPRSVTPDLRGHRRRWRGLHGGLVVLGHQRSVPLVRGVPDARGDGGGSPTGASGLLTDPAGAGHRSAPTVPEDRGHGPGSARRSMPRVATRSSWSSNHTRWQESTSVRSTQAVSPDRARVSAASKRLS